MIKNISKFAVLACVACFALSSQSEAAPHGAPGFGKPAPHAAHIHKPGDRHDMKRPGPDMKRPGFDVKRPGPDMKRPGPCVKRPVPGPGMKRPGPCVKRPIPGPGMKRPGPCVKRPIPKPCVKFNRKPGKPMARR